MTTKFNKLYFLKFNVALLLLFTLFFIKFARAEIKNEENYYLINKNCKLCMISRQTNAGCAIVKDKKLLLVRDKKTKMFRLPGGLKEKKEISVMTAIRNTLNETGYVVSIEDYISEFRSGFRLYKCKIVKDTGFTNGHIIETKYVNKEELGKMLKKENRKNVGFANELDVLFNKFDWLIIEQ